MFSMTVTLADVVRGIHNVVERFGADHIVQPAAPGGATCTYAVLNDKGQLVPVCIVGQFVSDLGLLRLLVSQNDSTLYPDMLDGDIGAVCNAGGIGAMLRERFSSFGIEFENGAWEFLMAAQGQQDGGFSWGTAFEVASRTVVERGFLTVTPDYTRAVLNATDNL